MTLSLAQTANRAAHRARLEIASRRAADAVDDVPRLLERRAMCREFLKTRREAMTVLEDEAFAQFVQITDIQRRLCELGYRGD